MLDTAVGLTKEYVHTMSCLEQAHTTDNITWQISGSTVSPIHSLMIDTCGTPFIKTY